MRTIYPTISDLRQIPCPSASKTMLAVLTCHGYTLELVEGNENINNRVDHERRIMYLEAWTVKPSLGSTAVILHECAHIIQTDSILFLTHVSLPFLRPLTRILLEWDANRRAYDLFDHKQDKSLADKLILFYRGCLSTYIVGKNT